jgi:hypothetical protein
MFCDSFVGNDTGILFASFWGRNTSLQQFLARMELPPHEGFDPSKYQAKE